MNTTKHENHGAVAGQVERGVRPLVDERDQGGALGVHWLGGRPYMLTSEPTRGQRMRAAGYARRPSSKSLPSDE